MLWFYVSDGQERLAVEEERLGSLVSGGVLRPTTSVWREGLPGWLSAGEALPELFWGGDGLAVPASAAATAGDAGLVTDLAGVLKIYAGWMAVAGWLHALTGVACVAMGTVVGYFAWLRPGRLVEWGSKVPAPLKGMLDHPWWTVGGCAVAGLVFLFMGVQLVGGSARAGRAEASGSREELRIALRSMGSFFRSTVISVLLGVLVLLGVVLYGTRPWARQAAPVEKQAPPVVKDRVTI